MRRSPHFRVGTARPPTAVLPDAHETDAVAGKVLRELLNLRAYAARLTSRDGLAAAR